VLDAFWGLLAIFEPLLSALFGPRHEPPRTDIRVLGDINPGDLQPPQSPN
jgi:hypothetical protein